MEIKRYFLNRSFKSKFRKITCFLPLRILYNVAYIFCKYFISKPDEKKIKENIKEVFKNANSVQIDSIFSSNIKHLVKHHVESFLYFNLSPRRLHNFLLSVPIKDICHLRDALEKKKGAIIISLHLGSFIFLPFILGSRCYHIRCLVVLNDEQLSEGKRVCNELGYHVKLVSVFNKTSSLSLYKGLINNEVIIIFYDYPFTGKKIKVEFLGKQMDGALGIAWLHAKTGAPLLISYCLRGEKNIPQLILKPFPELKSSNDTEMTTMTSKIYAQIEKIIIDYPEQWSLWKIYHEIGK